jgi:hypothetical protein
VRHQPGSGFGTGQRRFEIEHALQPASVEKTSRMAGAVK